MVKCACQTLKAEPCKKDAVDGSKFCAVHKKCATKTKTPAKKVAKAPLVKKAPAKKAPSKSPVKKAPVKTKAPAKKATVKKVVKAKPAKAPVKKAAPKPKGKAPKKAKTSTVGTTAALRSYITGSRDTDVLILKKMDAANLWNACKTNATIRKLCATDPKLSSTYFRLKVMALMLDFIKKYNKKIDECEHMNVYFDSEDPENEEEMYIPEDNESEDYRDERGFTCPRPVVYKIKGIPTRRISILTAPEDASEAKNLAKEINKLLKKNKILHVVYVVAPDLDNDFHEVSVFFGESENDLKKVTEPFHIPTKQGIYFLHI